MTRLVGTVVRKLPKRTVRSLRVALTATGLLLALAAGALPASALEGGVDGDGDGKVDLIELQLGSNPGDPTSVPESVAAPPSCLDGIDDDGDGQTDLADPGCSAPAPATATFPDAGQDAFDTRIVLDGYPFATAGLGTCPIDFQGRGPTVVQRTDPVDIGAGLRRIGVEVVAFQATGTMTVRAEPGCSLPPGDYRVTLFEDPRKASLGTVTDTVPDPTRDFPATGSVGVSFLLDTPLGAFEGGPPSGPPGTPLVVESTFSSLPPYHTGANPSCFGVGGLPHQFCPKAPPDRFKCYEGKFPRFRVQRANLRDQFGEGDTKVLELRFFCNPAAEEGGAPWDAAAHLTCHAIKHRRVRARVLVRNEFGAATVHVRQAAMLCVPSRKDEGAAPQELDHFECYRGRFSRFPARPLTIVDQFGTERTTVRRPYVLCNPVAKDGGPILDSLNHLVCYRIEPTPLRRTITVQSALASGPVRIRRSALVCVPSSKSSTSAPPTFGTDLTLGYAHLMPGLVSVCGRVSTTPPQPGATGTVNLTRTDGGMIPQNQSITLDDAGTARFGVGVASGLGQYEVYVTLEGPGGTGTATGTVDVVPGQSTCP